MARVLPGDAVLDEAGVRAFLEERFGSIGARGRFRHGEWSAAYRFRHGADELVARFSLYGEDFEQDRRAMRFATPALPIPEVLEIGQVPGGSYAVTRRASGVHLDTLDEAGMRRALPALFGAMDAMREADISATTGWGGWGLSGDGSAPDATWRDYLLGVAVDRTDNARIGGWRERLAASPIGMAPFDEAYEALRILADRVVVDRHLVHDDLLNYNVLVDAEEGTRITAVLDWGSSIYGDFLWDLACLAYWQPWYPKWASIDFAAEARGHLDAIGLHVPDFDLRLRTCMLRIGLSGLSYSALKGRWAQLTERARWTLEIARSTYVGLRSRSHPIRFL